MAFKIISDGSCDLGEDRARENDVTVIPFYVEVEDGSYKKEIEEIAVRDFYDLMVSHPDYFPKTTLPSVQDFMDVFEDTLKENKEILCMCISDKFSGAVNAARNAARMVMEDHPDVTIKVLNCRVNTVLQGILVLEACRMRDAGYSLEAAYDRLEEIIPSGRIFFTVGNYEYLVHGGRIGKLMQTMVGGLGIRPMIVLKEGEIFPAGIARGRKRSLDKVKSMFQKHFQKTKEKLDDYRMVIGFGYDYEEAVKFRDEVVKLIESMGSKIKVELFQIGCVIAAHTGPYAMGIAVLPRYDRP